MPRKARQADEQPAASPEVEDQSHTETGPEEGLIDDATSEAAPLAGSLARAVTFMLEGQLYGLPIEVVQEIQQLVEFTPLPDTAPSLVGLIDLRGQVVPAIDLRVLVGLGTRAFTLETPMVFCRVREHVVCLIVDGVEDVVDLPVDGLQSPSSLYNLADRMLGMCRLPQGLLLLLDIDRLIPDAAIAAAETSRDER